ncbi:MAG: DUF4328 domain-containing protein [Phycisphaerae bacterium]
MKQQEAVAETLSYEAPAAPVAVHGLTIVLLVCVSASVLAFSAWGLAYGLLADEWTRYGAGVGSPSIEMELTDWILPVANFGVPVSVLSVVVLLLVWVNRANRKLRSLGAKGLWYTPFRAVIDWVMPYRAFISPFYVMKELYTVSRGVSRAAFTPMVGCWWASWLGGSLMYLVAITAGGAKSEGETDAQFAADWAIWHLIPAPFYVVSGGLLLCIVWRVDRGLQRRTRQGLLQPEKGK